MTHKPVIVREVWRHNLASEFDLIEKSIPRYSLASFDTEFPGTIYSPNVEKHLLGHLSCHQNYQFMKANVDALKLIQLGLTLSDIDGNLPDFGTGNGFIWQFNFRDFDIDSDQCNPDSIALLQRQGIDFLRNRQEGIDSKLFGVRLRLSGLVSGRSGLSWVTFHSAYDFGFLIKLLTGKKLPGELAMFMALVRGYFGVSVYDLKYMMRYFDGLHGGLEAVAKSLGIPRLAGKSHQAGSDSLLTMHAYLKLIGLHFNRLVYENFNSVLYGLEDLSSFQLVS